jgi:ribosome maturation factor RimP
MSNATVLSSELFSTIRKDVSAHIRKKLRGMEIDVVDLDLHHSSLTKTLRVYVTVSRTNNLKALYLAERMICEELHIQLSLLPHSFYWRYLPEAKAPPPSASAS